MNRVGRFTVAALIALAPIALAAAPAHAWETSTHLGLVEQAALAADVDAWLRDLGQVGGLYAPLVVPPDDAPDLFAALANHSAADGFVPDLRGQQPALGWLLAGAALADATPQWAANHFFDPASGAGWRAPSPPMSLSLTQRVRTPPPHDAALMARSIRDVCNTYPTRPDKVPARGIPAPDWAVSKDNPLGLTGFLDQYEKAISGATPAERGRATAGALVAAGAVLHVLGDLGSPTHTRSDEAAHLASLGAGDDAGSRFERLTAIAWGRLGVPAAIALPTRANFRAYFTAAGDGTAAAVNTSAGLAEWSSSHFFSDGTLPRTTEVGRIKSDALAAVLARAQVRPLPALPRRLSMVVATQARGTTLRDDAGVCLARYRKDRGALSWWLDDTCELEQAAVILPVVAGYQASLLRWLTRGQLAVTVADGQVTVRARGVAVGAGTVTVFAEDGRGVRTALGATPVTAAADGDALTSVAAPKARRAVALYRGVDAGGEPVIAFGHVELP